MLYQVCKSIKDGTDISCNSPTLRLMAEDVKKTNLIDYKKEKKKRTKERKKRTSTS